MKKDYPNEAQESGISPNIDSKPKPRYQVPIRVCVFTLGDVNANALGTERDGVVTGIFLRPMYH